MIPTQHRPTLPSSPAARLTPADIARGGNDSFHGVAAAGTADAGLLVSGSSAPARKVLLVDDHDLMRLGIKALIDKDVACTIEWLEASSLGDAMKLCDAHADIALVLLDLNLADCKGLQGLSQLLGRHPQTRVIILSGTQDEFVVRQARSMGAVGYLHKAAPPALARDILLSALAVPGSALHPCAAAARFPKTGLSSRYDLVAQLGARHLEILELVLCGCTNQEISNETKLSLGTVKNYVSTILLALDVRSRSHLISLFR